MRNRPGPRPPGNGGPPFETSDDYDLAQLGNRLSALEGRFGRIETSNDQIKEMLSDIRGHLNHMPTATDFGAIKGTLQQMPTAQEFGEMKGRVNQLPTTVSLVVTLVIVALTVIAGTGVLQYVLLRLADGG